MSLTKIQQKKAANYGGNGFKSFPIDGKSLKVESRKISGMASTFGNIDEDRDRIHKGAFARSISERGPESNAKSKIVLLWQHEYKEPIGRITMLKEKMEGLYFEAELDEVPRGEQALKQLESGTINSFSIGFQYIWETMEYNFEDDCYECFELKLFEISPVSIPADPNTYYMGLKNAEDFAAAQLKLSEDWNAALKLLDIPKQQELHELLTRTKSLSQALSLSEYKERIKHSAAEKDSKSEEPPKLFEGLKFNKQ